MHAPRSECLFIDQKIVRLAGSEASLDEEIGHWLLLALRNASRKPSG